MVEVTQQDRDAAVWLFAEPDDKECLAGRLDHTQAVQAAAQHRIATEAQTVAEIVEWLRESGEWLRGTSHAGILADAIEQRAYK